QVKVWSMAVISISLLSACFIVSSVVTYNNSVNSKIVKKLYKLGEYQQYYSSLTCVTGGKEVEFWHSGEPNNPSERCAIVNFRHPSRKWGWNDVYCHEAEKSICEMMKIHL
uniref:C-type lectin domain-containing protein n=1 Tax=Propithecus coquereli TaxID=379532 RepID=A0A2K6FL62_PROCO